MSSFQCFCFAELDQWALTDIESCSDLTPDTNWTNRLLKGEITSQSLKGICIRVCLFLQALHFTVTENHLPSCLSPCLKPTASAHTSKCTSKRTCPIFNMPSCHCSLPHDWMEQKSWGSNKNKDIRPSNVVFWNIKSSSHTVFMPEWHYWLNTRYRASMPLSSSHTERNDRTNMVKAQGPIITAVAIC